MENRDELKELLESIDRKIQDYQDRKNHLLNMLEEFFNDDWGDEELNGDDNEQD